MYLKLLSPEAFFSSKCTKYRLVAGLRPDPLGSLQRSQDPLARLREPTSKGREWREGNEGRKKGKGRIEGRSLVDTP